MTSWIWFRTRTSWAKRAELTSCRAAVLPSRMSDANGNCRAQAKDPLVEIRRKLMEGDTIKTARQQASYLIDSSIASLAILDESPAKLELMGLARQVIRARQLIANWLHAFEAGIMMIRAFFVLVSLRVLMKVASTAKCGKSRQPPTAAARPTNR